MDGQRSWRELLAELCETPGDATLAQRWHGVLGKLCRDNFVLLRDDSTPIAGTGDTPSPIEVRV
jgi:hypothetical protein